MEVRHPEVDLGGGLDPVRLVAVVVLVQVGRDDLLLALDAGERLGQPDRLDDLLQLPFGLPRRILDEIGRQEPLAYQLLGDRRRAASPASEAVDPGRDDRHGIEAAVVPEGLVLDRGLGVDRDRRDVGERHHGACRGTEPGQLDRAGPVVDDRFLLEAELVEIRRSVEVRGKIAEGRHGTGGEDEAETGKQNPDDDRDHPRGRGLAAFAGQLARGDARSLVHGCSGGEGQATACHARPIRLRLEGRARLRRRDS